MARKSGPYLYQKKWDSHGPSDKGIFRRAASTVRIVQTGDDRSRVQRIPEMKTSWSFRMIGPLVTDHSSMGESMSQDGYVVSPEEVHSSRNFLRICFLKLALLWMPKSQIWCATRDLLQTLLKLVRCTWLWAMEMMRCTSDSKGR